MNESKGKNEIGTKRNFEISNDMEMTLSTPTPLATVTECCPSQRRSLLEDFKCPDVSFGQKSAILRNYERHRNQCLKLMVLMNHEPQGTVFNKD
ncbi:hypothetical protein MAR_012313 [Mya arenaria]|uniref:Uncharacterized protein n=1 Tax=Mya arenaria TaxID=6604 RepID=A0ABY7FZA2_MYAAR|nr:hypothetical protein MAR_012313 [Mya arenaria]